VTQRTIPWTDPGHGAAAHGVGISNAGVSTLKHASFPAAEIKSATIISFPEKRKGFFARFLDALHHMRHMQARRALGQYRHLIDRTEQRAALVGSKAASMSIAERPPAHRASRSLSD
jgi:hypothetical protein